MTLDAPLSARRSSRRIAARARVHHACRHRTERGEICVIFLDRMNDHPARDMCGAEHGKVLIAECLLNDEQHHPGAARDLVNAANHCPK